MTHLKKLMRDELERRNYALSTLRAYLRAIDEYARYFKRASDQLRPDHIRQYQANPNGCSSAFTPAPVK